MLSVVVSSLVGLFAPAFRLSVISSTRKVLVTGILFALLSTSVFAIPTTPQLVISGFNEWQKNVAVYLNRTSWFALLRNNPKSLLPFYTEETQETQADRDATVVRIETYLPASALVGSTVQLAALPLDANEIPVSGVTITWQVQGPDGSVKLDSSGLLNLPSLGSYKITASGAGREETSTVEVIEGERVSDSPTSIPNGDWNPANIEHAREPRNQRGDTPGIPRENSNFNIMAPIFSVPGKNGSNVALDMTYNSRLWTKLGSNISYDIDKDALAPGWSFGFGKIINLIDGGVVQVDANGTKHFFSGNVAVEDNQKVFEGQSNDGSFVKARFSAAGIYTENGLCYYGGGGRLDYPDGSSVLYSADLNGSRCYAPGSAISIYPTGVTDSNGNGFQIYYDSNAFSPAQPGKTITAIGDSLGRFYRFKYSLIGDRYYVTSITGSGLKDQDGNVTERTFARFNYKDLTVTHNFDGLTAVAPSAAVKVLSSIFYPGTQSGYWFGDADSYSSYGMIRKVEEHRGMSYDSASGVISPGLVNRRRIYNYPESTGAAINDVPEYDTVTETWDGMPDPSAPAITTYQVDWNSNPRTTTITAPYQGGKTIEYSFNYSNLPAIDPNKSKDGITFKTEFFDANNSLRSTDETDWGVGSLTFPSFVNTINASTYHVNLPRPNSITHTEIDNGNLLVKKTVNDVFGPYNRVQEMHEVGYNNETLRRTVTQYMDDVPIDPNLGGGRVINLPKIIEVYDSANNRIDYTEFKYDQNPVYVNCNNPGPTCGTVSRIRGDLSKVIKYSRVTNTTLEGQQISDNRVYDTQGNLISFAPSSLPVDQVFAVYTSDTNYAFPQKISNGDAVNPNQQVSSTTVYDLNTGLPLSITDANGQTTHFEYELQTWRLTKTILPTGAYSINEFDDLNRAYSQSAYSSSGRIAGQQITRVNGLKLPYRQESLAINSHTGDKYDVVETEYDNQGRIKRTSNPFRSNEQPHGAYWSEIFYDAAGRVEKTRSPDGSEKFTYYDETGRPDVASNALGHSFRIKDPIGREKWFRKDSDGNVVEVVEPDPDGSGSVAVNGLSTSYFYDSLGRLSRTVQGQGVQERRLQYDALGRIVNQKMAETRATLDDNGNFVGEANGQWSDHFVYDETSSISASTDARGVTKSLSYTDPATNQRDPLNRLYSISYDTHGNTDVIQSPTARYAYRSSGNVTQVQSAYTEYPQVTGAPVREASYDFLYDGYGRMTEKKAKLASRSDYPMTVNYTYNSLNQITDVLYPAQYNMLGNPRKTIHSDFDAAGSLKALKVDGTDFASNFVLNSNSQTTSVNIGAAGANQITEQYTYNSQNGLMENQKVIKNGSALLDLSYSYQHCSCSTGGSGQITSIADNLDHDRDHFYGYDSLGRIKSLTVGTAGSFNRALYSYQYDRYGNRLSSSVAFFGGPPPPPGGGGDDPPMGGGPRIADDALLPVDGGGEDGHTALSFDPASNRITTAGFEYDAAGNQTRIIKPDGTVLRFQYDAAGRLVKVKNVSGSTINTYTYGIGRERLVTQEGNESSAMLTYYASDGGSVIAEYAEGAGQNLVWIKNYIYMGGALLATQEKSGTSEILQFTHPDQIGTRMVTNPGAGTNVEQNTLPFGTEMQAGSTGSINQRFTSYDRSTATGLDYANNRFYDSGQGRFMTVDPIKMDAVHMLNPQTLNLYAYVTNDPVNKTDPSGLDGITTGVFTGGGSHGGIFPGGTGGGTISGWGQFLTGLWGNLFGGHSYALTVGHPTYFWQMNTGFFYTAPPLPGAGTVAEVAQPSNVLDDCSTIKLYSVSNWATDASSDGSVSRYPYVSPVVLTDFVSAIDEISKGNGSPVGFSELFRPFDVQVDYYQKYQANLKADAAGKPRPYQNIKKAARVTANDYPGRSNHGAGFSFDMPERFINARITSGPYAGKTVEKVFNAFGFFRNETGDKPHFNYKIKPTATQKREAQDYYKDCIATSH